MLMLVLMLMLSHAHAHEQRMLVYFNDMLSSGYIPDLYTPDDTDNIINAIRPEVTARLLILWHPLPYLNSISSPTR